MQHLSGLFQRNLFTHSGFPVEMAWRLRAPCSRGNEWLPSKDPQCHLISRTRRSLRKKKEKKTPCAHRQLGLDLQNVHLTENDEVGHCKTELLRVLPTDVVVHGVLLQNAVHTTVRTSWNVKGRVTPITNVTKFPQNCTNLLQYRKIFTRTLFLKV